MKYELTERAREARKEYLRRWRQTNREKVQNRENARWEKYADFLEAEAKAKAQKENGADSRISGNGN